ECPQEVNVVKCSPDGRVGLPAPQSGAGCAVFEAVPALRGFYHRAAPRPDPVAPCRLQGHWQPAEKEQPRLSGADICEPEPSRPHAASAVLTPRVRGPALPREPVWTPG